MDQQALDAIAKGRYMGQVAEAFLARLSDCVSHVLTAHCCLFLKQLDEALAEGEPDMALLLATRFRRNIQRCFFYRTLTFLSASYVKTLDQGFCNQLDAFWQDFLGQLLRSARESSDPRMEDVLLEMKRIRLTQRRVETNE